jgi:predicted nucleic acid-binding protein
LTDKKKVYWDSCSWLGFINEDEDKIVGLRYVLDQAKNGAIDILTSTVTLAEVFRLKCERGVERLPEDKDKIFEDLLDQPYVVYVQVTRDVGIWARRLLRRTTGLKCPQDAIHLASAAINNADELHTFDGNHLLPFDNQIDRKDGKKLRICQPQLPPPPPPEDDLFSRRQKEEEEEAQKACKIEAELPKQELAMSDIAPKEVIPNEEVKQEERDAGKIAESVKPIDATR